LGAEEIRLTKESLGWSHEADFYIPDEALSYFRKAVQHGNEQEKAWRKALTVYQEHHPEKAKQFQQALSGELPEGWQKKLPTFEPSDGSIATRAVSGKILNAIATVIPNLIGGSADLAPSNNTYLDGYPVFANESYAGRNFHFGVREHGMAGILNGMALHGGVIPYGATFLVFSDYCRPSIRMAALSHIPAIFIFTHDSIGLGEDGPTHQPIEQIASLRTIPNLTIIRPADANETIEAWKVALEKRDGPVILLLTRQKLLTYDRSTLGKATGLSHGAYILSKGDKEKPDVILIATGSEVELAMAAQPKLAKQGISARVVSMPSWELFKAQSDNYRDFVLPPDIKARLAIEAGSTFGWHQWVGEQGKIIGLDRFGASAPYEVIYQQLGFTVDNVVLKALAAIEPTKR